MVVDQKERSIKEYLFQIGFDFIAQLEKKLKSGEMSQDDFAEKLNLSKGRVSQILNSPGNLTLSKVIEYSLALGMKVALVAYDDGDPENKRGPINSDIFRICWEKAGKPVDFWACNDINSGMVVTSSSSHAIDTDQSFQFIDSLYTLPEYKERTVSVSNNKDSEKLRIQFLPGGVLGWPNRQRTY